MDASNSRKHGSKLLMAIAGNKVQDNYDNDRKQGSEQLRHQLLETGSDWFGSGFSSRVFCSGYLNVAKKKKRLAAVDRMVETGF
jgi:hypothetical protein